MNNDSLKKGMDFYIKEDVIYHQPENIFSGKNMSIVSNTSTNSKSAARKSISKKFA